MGGDVRHCIHTSLHHPSKGKNRDWQVLEVNVVMGIYKHLSKGGMSSSLPAFKCKLSEDLLAKRQ